MTGEKKKEMLLAGRSCAGAWQYGQVMWAFFKWKSSYVLLRRKKGEYL